MLLSFARFEREVTSERIRDKIAASKKKGMWMAATRLLATSVMSGRCLAFLAPDIQEAIMEGRQPVGMTLQSLRGTLLPLSWEDQCILFGMRS